MPFTVEDGTIIEGANSYVSLGDANAYHLDRGNAAWTGTDDQKKAALVKATDYIDQTYPFIGELLEVDQPLAWPRLIDETASGIPVKVKQATCQLALEALTTDISATTDKGGVKREKVDVIETEYFEAKTSGTVRKAIDGLLKALTIGRSLNVPVVRV